MRDRGFGMTSMQRPEKRNKRSGKRNNEELGVKNQLLQATKDEQATSVGKKEKRRAVSKWRFNFYNFM
jgi:hypothetical protein